MLTDTLTNISELLGISDSIIPNIITLMFVAVILFISLKSQLSLSAMIMIYVVSMTILTLLGIDSVFNLITLLEDVIDTVIDLVF